MMKEHILMKMQSFLGELTRQFEYFSMSLSRYDIHDVQSFDSISGKLTFTASLETSGKLTKKPILREQKTMGTKLVRLLL